MARTITSANSVFTISLPDVFPANPLTLQGYATDDAFSNEPVDAVEVKMGVDAFMSGGYTPYITKTIVHLQADSPSISIFETWLAFMDAAKEVFYADATIILTGIGKTYNLHKGALTRPMKFADVKKTLQPVVHEISWEVVTPAQSQ